MVVKITTGEGSKAESSGPPCPAGDSAPWQERVDPILLEVSNGIRLKI